LSARESSEGAIMISAGLRRRRLDIIEEHLNTEVTK
jgi:hypothetical protein